MHRPNVVDNGVHGNASGEFYTQEVHYSNYVLKTEELEREIHNLINQERVNNGLPSFSLCFCHCFLQYCSNVFSSCQDWCRFQTSFPDSIDSEESVHGADHL
jgi:hypothetical protein